MRIPIIDKREYGTIELMEQAKRYISKRGKCIVELKLAEPDKYKDNDSARRISMMFADLTMYVERFSMKDGLHALVDKEGAPAMRIKVMSDQILPMMLGYQQGKYPDVKVKWDVSGGWLTEKLHSLKSYWGN